MRFSPFAFTLILLSTLCAPAPAAQNWDSQPWVEQNNALQQNTLDTATSEAPNNNENNNENVSKPDANSPGPERTNTNEPIDIVSLGAVSSARTKTDFEFTVDLDIRRAVIRDFIANNADNHPEFTNTLRGLDTSFFRVAQRDLSRQNLSTTNYADAMTTYLIELHGIANGIDHQTTPEIATALRRQVINMVTQRVSPEAFEDKAAMQAASDKLILRAVLISYLHVEATQMGDRHSRQQADQFTAEAFGVRFTQLELDSRGLTRKS